MNANQGLVLLTILAIALIALIALIACMPEKKKEKEEKDNFSAARSLLAAEAPQIPHLIWTYWHDTNNIPPIIGKCMESWKRTNPEYKITVLNIDKVYELCGVDLRKDDAIVQGTHARISDYCRLIVLAKFGGFWIDASMLCLEPLEWVHEVQQAHGAEMVGFFAPHTRLDDYPIPESWFIAAPAASQFINDWMLEGLTMARAFTNDVAYVKHIKENTKTDLQGLEIQLPYLVIHLWATVVLQRRSKNNLYMVHLMSAMDGIQGPFKYLNTNQWKSLESLEALCANKSLQTKLIKMRGAERGYLETHGKGMVCEEATAHPSIYDMFNSLKQ
jgi:hypothetical protein